MNMGMSDFLYYNNFSGKESISILPENTTTATLNADIHMGDLIVSEP